jgi:hypothetical protein
MVEKAMLFVAVAVWKKVNLHSKKYLLSADLGAKFERKP